MTNPKDDQVAQHLLRTLLNDAILKSFTSGVYGLFGVTWKVADGGFVEAKPINEPVVRIPKPAA